MLEFAFVSIFFLLLVFAVMEYGWLMFAQMNVQQAVDDGGRYASTGQNNGTSRIASIVTTIQNEIGVPGVNVAQNISICSTPSGGTTQTCYNSGLLIGNIGAAGAPNATVKISLTTPLPLITPLISQFFPGGGYSFTSSSTFKNEPFSPTSTD
jgi:Flp pilus assembly protein TadG